MASTSWPSTGPRYFRPRSANSGCGLRASFIPAFAACSAEYSVRPDQRQALHGALAVLERLLVARQQPQRRQLARQPADRRRVGAPVVVDDDHHGPVGGRGDVVQRLPAHPAGEGPVADDGHHRAVAAGERVGLREAVRPRQRGGGVGVLDQVVLALGAARVAREPADLPQPVEVAGTAREDLVDVALVARVEDQRVPRASRRPGAGRASAPPHPGSARGARRCGTPGRRGTRGSRRRGRRPRPRRDRAGPRGCGHGPSTSRGHLCSAGANGSPSLRTRGPGAVRPNRRRRRDHQVRGRRAT